MSEIRDSINSQFIHVRKFEDRIKIQGAISCALGHEISTEGSAVREGIYAGWQWDGERLSVVNDRFGFYPLYYFVRHDECAVSPSLPRLLALGAPTELDYDALAVFFHLGYFVGEDTPFQAVRAVPPDTFFEWRNGMLTISGRPATAKPQALDRKQAVDAYIDLFRQAIVRRLPQSEEFAVLLSGGRDSRHILLELLRNGARPRLCLTLDLPQARHESDAIVAAQLAKAVDVSHVVLPATDLSFWAEYAKNLKTNLCADEHTWMMSGAQYLQGKVDTVYDGIGGDVLSAGLFLTVRRLELCESGQFGELAEDLVGTRSIPPFTCSAVGSLVSRDAAVARLDKELQKHADAPNPFSSFIFWNRTRREIALSSYSILADIGTIFSPYLDHAVYDLLAGLPGRMFVDHSFHTEAISRAFPQHAHIPYSGKPGAAEQIGTPGRRRLWRRFAVDVIRHCLMRQSSLLNKRFLLPRLLRCLCDPGYLPSVLWLGPPAVYLLQLERFWKQKSKSHVDGIHEAAAWEVQDQAGCGLRERNLT